MTQVAALLKRMPSMQQRHHATTSFCRRSVDGGDMVIYGKEVVFNREWGEKEWNELIFA